MATKAASNGRAIAPSVAAPVAAPTGASSAVNVAAPVAAPYIPTSAPTPVSYSVSEPAWGTLASLAEGVTLIGTVKSHYDGLSDFAESAGVPGYYLLAENREHVLRRASFHLKGLHTGRGVAHVALAKSIVEAIGELDDKEARKRLLVAWRRASALFALVRVSDGEFGAGSFNG